MTGIPFLLIVLSYALRTQCTWALWWEGNTRGGCILLSTSTRNTLACASHNFSARGHGAGKRASQVFCCQGGNHGLRVFPPSYQTPKVRFVSRRFSPIVSPPCNDGLSAPQTPNCPVHLGSINSFMNKAISSKATCFRRGMHSNHDISEWQGTPSTPTAFAQLRPLLLTATYTIEPRINCKYSSHYLEFDALGRIAAWRRCAQRRRPAPKTHTSGEQSEVRAQRCPLLNVIDFASTRSPPLSAKELLRQQHHSQSVSLQVRISTLAAKAAVDSDRQREGSVEEAAQVHHYRSSATLSQNLQNYRALLFFTSWDTLSQAMVAALNDLASFLGPHNNTVPATGGGETPLHEEHKEGYAVAAEVFPKSRCLSGEIETHESRRLGWTADRRARESGEVEWTALRKWVAKRNVEMRRDEGLSLVIDRITPSWLPIIGVRAYNSLVLCQGRRAIEKHKRMLTNRKQLRHHERALLLMVNEGIHYGAGHLPTLQIWRVEDGLRRQDGVHSEFSTSFVKKHEPGSLGCVTADVDFIKVFEARGCGPIKLMELAGGNPEPWRAEEALVLKRALVSRVSPRTKGYATAGILSTGVGEWSSTSCHGIVRDDVSVWLAQLSTLYQYHALSLLLERLSYAERQFPEFEEFNLRKLRLTKAKQKCLLSEFGL